MELTSNVGIPNVNSPLYSFALNQINLVKVSIIIPTLNEEDYIRSLVCFLSNHADSDDFEVIVVDGGSTDHTLNVIADFEEVRILHSDVASRPVQMNLGARHASHDLLYFVHADVRLPHSFYHDLKAAVKHYDIGGYRYRFDSTNWLLRFNAFFTRFPMMWCRGGDQTLFIKRTLFEQLNGFDEYFTVMEDFDLIKRAKKLTPFCIIPKNVIVSARKYHHNNYLKVQLTNLKAFRMFKNGEHPEKIRQFYKKTLNLADY